MKYLNIIFGILFSFLIVFCIQSQTPSLSWVKSTNTNNFSVANSVEVDNQGNVFSVGQFTATTDFDFGTGTFNLTPNGAEDVFVQKMDSDGNLLWVFQIGGLGSSLGYDDDNIADVEIDVFGNIIIIGQFGGTCDFDPSINDFLISSVGNSDVFIAKYSTNGEFIWAKSIGGSNIDSGTSINSDVNNNIFATGQYYGTVDFDPSVNSFLLSSNGNSDIFTLKLNGNGDFIWVIGTGGFSSDLAYGTTDSNNNVLESGHFGGTVDFDPNNSIFNLSSSVYYSIFIRKLDQNGQFVWAKGISCSVGSCGATSITTDLNNNVIITGFFSGTCDFDPGPNNYSLTSNGGTDIFILKLNSNGDFLWANSIGGNSTEYGVSIICDASNNIYTNGVLESPTYTVDFDPGNNSYYLAEPAGSFFLKLDENGNFNWACMPQSSQNLYNVSLCLTNQNSGVGINGGFCIAEKNNQFYVCGAYMNSVDFDPSITTFNLTSLVPNVNKYFVQKLNICNQTNTNIYENSCQSYTWPSNNTTYTTSGTYTDTLVNVFGCDSMVTLNLTILPAQTNSVSITQCDSYTSPLGNTYNSSGTFTETYSNVNGCDSVVTLNLTITSIQNTVDVSSCGNYISPLGNNYNSSGSYQETYTTTNGCDSTVTIQLTINNSTTVNETKSACTSYLSPSGNTYTQSGQYYDTLLTSLGCDSIIITQLTILSSTQATISPIVCGSYTSPSGITYNQTGTYIDTIQNLNGCDSIITINLSVIGALNVNAGQDISICIGESITLNGAGATTYSWSNGVTNNSPFSPTVTTNYEVIGTDGNGCSGIDSILVTVNNPPTIAFNSILPDCEGGISGSINVSVTGSSPFTYQWSNGSVTQNLTNVSTGNYIITVTDVNGCKVENNFNLQDGEGDCLIVPTGFSPNGDNENDTWNIIGIEQFTKNHVQVFNRWGQTVFESNGTVINWNGSYQDKLLPVADYYFVVDLGNGQVFNGTLTIKY